MPGGASHAGRLPSKGPHKVELGLFPSPQYLDRLGVDGSSMNCLCSYPQGSASGNLLSPASNLQAIFRSPPVASSLKGAVGVAVVVLKGAME